MKEMEFQARKEARRALIASRRAANELLLRNGFEQFGLSSASESEEESDIDIEEGDKKRGEDGEQKITKRKGA